MQSKTLLALFIGLTLIGSVANAQDLIDSFGGNSMTDGNPFGVDSTTESGSNPFGESYTIDISPTNENTLPSDNLNYGNNLINDNPDAGNIPFSGNPITGNNPFNQIPIIEINPFSQNPKITDLNHPTVKSHLLSSKKKASNVKNSTNHSTLPPQNITVLNLTIVNNTNITSPINLSKASGDINIINGRNQSHGTGTYNVSFDNITNVTMVNRTSNINHSNSTNITNNKNNLSDSRLAISHSNLSARNLSSLGAGSKKRKLKMQMYLTPNN